jgi:hypothetical protein
MNCFCKRLLIHLIIFSLSFLWSKDNKWHYWGHRTFNDNFVTSHESHICSLTSPLKDSLSYKMPIYHLHLNQVSFYAVSAMTSHTLKTAFDLNNKREILFCSRDIKSKKFMRSQTHNSAHIFFITWAPVFCRFILIVS